MQKKPDKPRQEMSHVTVPVADWQGPIITLFWLIVATAGLAVGSGSDTSVAGPGGTTGYCAVVSIDRIGWDRVTHLKTNGAVDWWLEYGDQLLIGGPLPELDSVLVGYQVDREFYRVDPEALAWVRGCWAQELVATGVTVLAGQGRLFVVSGDVLELQQGWSEAQDPRFFPRVVKVAPNTVLRQQAANAAPRRSALFAGDIQDLVAEVDANRWFNDVVSLAAYNRYTLGPEINLARDWLVQQFTAMPGLTVTTQSFDVSGVPAYNVVATLTGQFRPDDWYLVGGHYDSTSTDPLFAAPGAEDNASGCAGVLELARIFTAHPPEATMIFICFSGEEQGLIGSEYHAASLDISGDADKVEAVLNMDMIGYTEDSDLDCLLESEDFAQALVNVFSDAAAEFTNLRIETAFYAWGSDHVPYLNRNIEALLTIENDWDSYPDYHQTTDLPGNLSLAMGGEILKMNVAAMAEIGGALSGPLFADGFESGDLTAWSLSSGE